MSALGLLLILAGMVIGPVTVLVIYLVLSRRHRNVPLRFVFESGTRTEVANLRSRDVRLGENNRQREDRMVGANSSQHLARVQKILVR